jgi:hypothetical protein
LVPAEVGAKVTLTVQVAPAVSVAGNVPQVLVSANCNGLAPPNAMLLMVRGALAPFVSVTVCGALVVLIVWFGNARKFVDKP